MIAETCPPQSATLCDEYTRDNQMHYERSCIVKGGIWNPDDLTVECKCVFCSRSNFFTVATRKDGLPIRQCRSCGLAYIDPRPSSKQLFEYYEGGYFSGEKDFFKGKDYCRERDISLQQQGTVTGYEEVISNFDVRSKVILDVGCASGALLHLLRKKNGADVIGIDSAKYPVSFGRSRYGLDLRNETLESAKFPDASFDLVVLVDVIEHVEDLNSFVRELRRILKPRGSIFLSTPNYLAYNVAKSGWTCLHQDFEHLQYFSRLSLEATFGNVGLKLDRCWTDGLPFQTKEYPDLRRFHLHRLIHPEVALKNALARVRHHMLDRRKDLGLNLKAIISIS